MSPARYCLVAAPGVLAGASIFLPGACSSDTGTEPGNPTPAEAGLSDQDAAADNAPTTDAIEVTPDTLESSPLDAIDEYVPPAELAWLFDPELWTPLAAAEFTKPNCSVYEAVHKKLPPLALEWQGCGDGCEWADVTLGLGAAGDSVLLDTLDEAGKGVGVLRLTHGVKAASRRVLFTRQLVLPAGNTLGALKHDEAVAAKWAYCSVLGDRSATWLLLGGGDPDHNVGSRVLWGRASIDGSPWRWATPDYPATDDPPAAQFFDISFSAGRVFAVGGGGVYAMQDMSSSQWTTIEQPSAAQKGAGEGDLAIWTDTSIKPNPGIRGWAPDGSGVRTIIDTIPKFPDAVAISPSSLVGFMGIRLSDYIFDSPQLWLTPRAYHPSQVKLTTSPVLAAQPVGCSGVQSWGDYAVVSISIPQDASLLWKETFTLLVHLPSWTLWRVDPPAGRVWHGYTLATGYLYMVDVPDTETKPGTASRVYRLDLSKISQWAKPYSY